jgi:hypothetical protein
MAMTRALNRIGGFMGASTLRSSFRAGMAGNYSGAARSLGAWAGGGKGMRGLARGGALAVGAGIGMGVAGMLGRGIGGTMMNNPGKITGAGILGGAVGRRFGRGGMGAGIGAAAMTLGAWGLG